MELLVADQEEVVVTNNRSRNGDVTAENISYYNYNILWKYLK